MTQRTVAKHRMVAVRDGVATARTDDLAGEEPLEIRVDGQAVAVTMRTPGDDFDLAIGFCLTEGLLASASDVATARYCVGEAEQQYNVVDVGRRAKGLVDERLKRNVYTSSSCGLCGTASIEAVRRSAADVADDPVTLSVAEVAALPARLRGEQRLFDRTGGLHAAGLFSPASELVCLREDVGRHNAVDKVIGWAVREQRLPLHGAILVVSGRVAFEIVQKALIAGIPVIVAVSAPTSLAVALAEESGMTLVGFARDGNCNVYTHPGRVLV